MIRRRPVVICGVLFAAVMVSVACRDSGAPCQAIFEAEESRAPDPLSLKILVDALKHSEAGIRRTAVRALGRLVRPALVEIIAPLLNDPDAAVRSEAANALAQSVSDMRPGESTAEKSANNADVLVRVFRLLESRLNREQSQATRGVIVRTIGRLAHPNEAEYRKAEKILLAIAGNERAETDPARCPEVYGAAKGIESLLRRKAKAIQADDGLITRLKSMITAIPPTGQNPVVSEDRARIRRLAMMALTWAGKLDEQTLEAASADPDEQVQRLVLFGLGRMGPEKLTGDAVERLIRRGLGDRSNSVRYEALRLYGRVRLDVDPAPVLSALDDSSPHVALLAVDLLGQLKTIPDPIITKLKELADKLSSVSSSAAGTSEAGASVFGSSASRMKLMAAHALASLAKTAPNHARGILPDFINAPEWVVRLYAAEAAITLKDIQELERLAGDSHDNVRNAALSGLIILKGHAVDDLCLATLERNDYQLILTAAGGLKGSPSAERTVSVLLSALARLTAQKRETSRDPRLAILERLGELSSIEQAEAVSTFELTLFVDEAPATVVRFVELARRGYYDGLTIHRIVPNFLIQGGSPGANEYTGDGSFMRDESGLESNTRGTVGISTRGRDTGDAQFYINTADNDRLDHDYCVFARVTCGMGVIDRILEGDVIERVEILQPKSSNGR
ncbi:MAG: peptidylprolyl isomerase [Candidatus Aminicenantes bacterium]|nr:peptidylprolyl isomerase [Candidatus Aminicenantes bacterium]